MHMKLFSLIGASLAVRLSFGQVPMNQIDPVGALTVTSRFGVFQIFEPAFQAFNSTVVDDFQSNGTAITEVGAAFEVSNPSINLANIQGWRVSVWQSPADASMSGTSLSERAAATIIVAPQSGSMTQLTNTWYRVKLLLNLIVPAGRLWFGMAPILDFDPNGQTYILSNPSPDVLGSNTNNSSVGVNPGNGFGLGALVTVDTNAAYYVKQGGGGGGGFLETVIPADYVIKSGRRSSGDLQSLRGPDGDSLVVCRFVTPNISNPPVAVEVKGETEFPFPSQIIVRTKQRVSNSNGQFLQRLELFDYVNLKYDTVRLETPMQPGWNYIEFPAAQPVNRFVSAQNQMKVKLSFFETGPTSAYLWCMDIDNVQWDLYAF